MKNIQITTLNVGRMKDFHKRDNTFKYLRTLKSHIYCIQEHNCAEEDQSAWEKHWGGKIIWSQHAAILLTRAIKPSGSRSISQGRILQIDLLITNKPITITNIYAPAYQPEKRPFYTNFPTLQAHPIHIIAGDLNIIPNAAIDRSPPGIGNSPLWQLLLGTLPNITDTVRHFEPDKPAFTHTQNVGNKLVQTRIDHILTSPEALNMVTKPITSFAPFSDHRAITVSLQLEKKKPEAAWKLNNSFLKEEDFRNRITSVIKSTQEEGRGEGEIDS